MQRVGRVPLGASASLLLLVSPHERVKWCSLCSSSARVACKWQSRNGLQDFLPHHCRLHLCLCLLRLCAGPLQGLSDCHVKDLLLVEEANDG